MAAHGWSIHQWGSYNVPALKAKWRELLTINQMHSERRQDNKEYCLGCSPRLMDKAIKMICLHLDKMREVRTQETAPHRIRFKDGYPTFEWLDRFPDDEFKCNLAGWDNAQKLDFKALPWNNERHDRINIIPLDTVFNYHQQLGSTVHVVSQDQWLLQQLQFRQRQRNTAKVANLVQI